MKILFVCYSSTGNTEHVAHLIGNVFEKAGHETKFLSAIKYIKALGLGKKDEKIEINSAEKPESLIEMEREFSSADVMGIGAYAFCWTSAPGFHEVFSPKVLSSDCFKNVKFIFSFATYGWRIGETLNVISTTLHSRSPSAVFLGGVGIHTPENVVALLPHKPYRDQWDPAEIEKAKNFGEALVNLLKRSDFSGIEPYKNVPFEYTDMVRNMTKNAGLKILVESSCGKCGLCVNICPYSAISISKDKNNGFPVFDDDSCWDCCRCFNKCPMEAINFVKAFESEKRTRHPLPFIDPNTGLSPATAVTAKGETVVGTPLPDGKILTQRLGVK